MKHTWGNTVFPIAAIFSFRMLGLFMLIPIFTLYANQLAFATPTLIGIALGSYGLSQGLLQIPFGILSDKLGRKNIITLGLVLFAIGSLFGALTSSIYGMIFARILQGMGAIGGVLIALLSDLTPDEQRTKSMAVIGVTIGLSFSLAMVISPVITQRYGLSGIFYITILLAIAGLFLLHVVIPNPKREPFHLDSESNTKLFKQAIANIHLQRLNGSIFLQHLVLTSTFFVLPLILKEQVSFGNLHQQWHFYLAIILFAFIAMIPFIVLAEKRNQIKIILLGAVIFTTISQLILSFFYTHWMGLCFCVFSYFLAFNILEALIPSLISKHAGIKGKGTAMGIYSSSQFLGIFVGGVLSGFLYQITNISTIFMMNALLSLVWFILVFRIKPNAYEVTLIIPYPQKQKKEEFIKQLEKLKGVKEVVFSEEESIFYLRINKQEYIEGSANAILHS